MTIVISAAVATLIFAYSATAKGPGAGGGTNAQHGAIFNPPPPPTGGTNPQAGTGAVGDLKPGSKNPLTSVTSNYDGKHGEKVTTVTVNADGTSGTTTTRTYDANGKQTSCSGPGC
jgi:hypothetical protein